MPEELTCEPHNLFYCCSDLVGNLCDLIDCECASYKGECHRPYYLEEGMIKEAHTGIVIDECPYCGAMILTEEAASAANTHGLKRENEHKNSSTAETARQEGGVKT